jgi:group I intron endonuclease
MGHDDALNLSGVYTIRCEPTGKVYVGSAVHLARRWRTHKAQLRRGDHHSQHLQRAWNKYGESAFVFQVIELAQKECLIPCEQKHIDALRACNPAVGYNMAPNAGNTLGIKLGAFTQAHRDKISAALRGRTLSAEHLEKIRKLNVGRPSPKKGKTLNLSADARMRMSVAKKGKKLSAEHVAKLVVAHTGAKRSDAARVSMSLARRGVPATERQLESIMATAQKRRKFSDAQVAEIRQRIAIRQPIVGIAAEFGCNPNTIYRIKNNERKAYL